jgi:hypothetical protein
MNLKDLTQLDEEQQELAQSTALKATKGGFSELDLYPEFKSRLYKKAYTNRLKNHPLTLQLPFYDTLIVPIYPVQTSACYEKLYGISFKQTLTLIDQGNIVPLLAKGYTAFTDLENDYMDELLEHAPATVNRLNQLDTILMAKNGLLEGGTIPNFNELQQVKERILAGLSKRAEQIEAHHHPEEKHVGWVNPDPDNIGPVNGGWSIPRFYTEFCIRGYCDLAEQLIALDRIPSLISLAGYSEFLITAPYRALGGSPSVENVYLDMARMATAAITQDDLVRAFPVEIGELLIDRFNLVNTTDIDLDGAIYVWNKTKEARRALVELDRAIARGANLSEVINKKEAITEFFNNVNQECDSLVKKKSKIATRYIPFSLAIIGGTADYVTGLHGMISFSLQMIWQEISNKRFVEKRIEAFLELRRPPYVCAVYDLRNEVNKGTD